jgi:hypothetical protein
MKEIILTKGQVALVDDEDFESLSLHKWYADKSKSSNETYYAARAAIIDGSRKILPMHRQILGLKPSHIFVDHIDGDGLNNQKTNLRTCSHVQNLRNSRKRKTPTSSFYKGVYWDKQMSKWRSRYRLDGNSYHIGLYDSEKEAALAYNCSASFAYREFAYLNKIER